jgi:RNA polymerase sigma factor (sigma-70 family)
MNKDFEALFLKELNSNIGIVHHVTRAYFADNESRKDSFQEIIFQLWQSYPGFNGSSKFSTWMYKVALNTAIRLSRKETKYNDLVSLDHLAVSDQEVKENTSSEKITMLYRCINSLNDIDKAIILLYLDENSYEEIASVTGLTKTNISVRLVRIKRTLEEKMRNHI